MYKDFETIVDSVGRRYVLEMKRHGKGRRWQITINSDHNNSKTIIDLGKKRAAMNLMFFFKTL